MRLLRSVVAHVGPTLAAVILVIAWLAVIYGANELLGNLTDTGATCERPVNCEQVSGPGPGNGH